MNQLLQSLFDKQDTFEIVRDQVARLIADESANQQALAIAAGKDPAAWALRVYTERSNPWETIVRSNDGDKPDRTPIVNIWYSNSSFNESASSVVKDQKSESIFNVDLYGFAISKAIPGGGHVPGDKQSNLEVQRAIKLVRNILMSGLNTYLQLRGTVWRRWVQSIETFQPEQDGRPIDNVTGARVSLRVGFTETSPQYEGCPAESVNVDLRRAEDGQVLAVCEWDYTT